MTYPFHHISTRWKLPALAIVAAALVAILTFIATSQSTYNRNLTTLHELQRQNQADTVFRSDSLQRALVSYFDSHRFTPHGLINRSRLANDRLLAHYLLGRAYADMGDAPMAIQAYNEAIGCADTTDTRCDYAILRSVYGQMAAIFDFQNLPDEQLGALKRCEQCELRLGDTIQAIGCYARRMNVHYLKSDTDSVMIVAKEMIRRFEAASAAKEAMQYFSTPISIYMDRGDFDSADSMLRQVRMNNNIFYDPDTPRPGRELYYYILGRNHEVQNHTDSAEYCYRKAMEYGFYEAAYRGLLSVYHTREVSDSIYKYSRLYCDANDYYHDGKRTEEVERASKLYNYTVQQRMAHDNAVNADRLRLCIALLLLLTVAIYGHMRRLQIRRMAYITNLRSQLSDVRLWREQAERKLERMTLENGVQPEPKTQQLSATQKELTGYREMEESLVRQLKESKISDFIESMAEDSRVKRLKQLAVPKKGNNETSDADWNTLIETCQPRLNVIIERVRKDQALTSRDLYACLLILMDFSNTDIMNLFGLATRQAVNEIKKKINRHLFDDTSARTLRTNLLRFVAKNADSTED